MDTHSVAVNGCRVKVLSPRGRVASPYQIIGNALVKRCSEKHIFRARQAIGIDKHVWQQVKERVSVVRFVFADKRVYEIERGDFERKSFPHGDGLTFAETLFVPISELTLVREAPPARGQLALALG